MHFSVFTGEFSRTANTFTGEFSHMFNTFTGDFLYFSALLPFTSGCKITKNK